MFSERGIEETGDLSVHFHKVVTIPRTGLLRYGVHVLSLLGNAWSYWLELVSVWSSVGSLLSSSSSRLFTFLLAFFSQSSVHRPSPSSVV